MKRKVVLQWKQAGWPITESSQGEPFVIEHRGLSISIGTIVMVDETRKIVQVELDDDITVITTEAGQ